MIVYTVHEPPKEAADLSERAERIVFVREGFSFLALLLGPLWFLIKGLWLAFAVAVALIVGSVFLFESLGTAEPYVAGFSILLHVLLGFEARNIERWTLARRGWRMLGAVAGRDMDECERRFIEGWLDVRRARRAADPVRPAPTILNRDEPPGPAESGWRQV